MALKAPDSAETRRFEGMAEGWKILSRTQARLDGRRLFRHHRQSIRMKVTLRSTRYSAILPFLAMTFCSLTHAPSTF
jgi:hypothetical protein